jgi:endoglucanase
MAIYSRGLAAKGKTTEADEVMKFAERQLAYIMGATGHSFVVGFGCNPPQNPHHRDSALTLEESGNWNVFNTRATNANPIVGAMVGGPNPSDGWEDDRSDYQRNEVALDYNAALLFGTVQVGR